MKKRFLCIYLFLAVTAFGQTPHLQGSIYLDIPQGLITCNFKITNTSAKGAYSISINRGFNLKYYKLDDKILSQAPKVNFNTIDYDLYLPNDSLPLKSVENVSVAYSGAFPVFHGLDSTDSDDMGVIAIKNGIMRATGQSVFVPELVDRETGKHISSYTYDIIVTCSKTETVYLNGCNPQKGKKLHFVNNSPLDFMLYAGDYKFQHQGNVYILNSTLDEKYVAVLAKTTKQISEFYATVMGIPYDASITFPQIFSVGPKNQYEHWGFTVTPTIVIDLNSLTSKSLFKI